LLGDEGLRILTGSRVRRVLREGDGRVVEVDRRGQHVRLTAEQVLVATGRRANTDGLGLESIDARLRPDGTLLVDETLETTAPGVFAAGDVVGEPAFVYTAAYEGRLAAENALGPRPGREGSRSTWRGCRSPRCRARSSPATPGAS
jgi:mercuric reductase